MRAIRLARLDKTRPALILTREQVLPYVTSVTVAPITTTIRGLSTEVLLDPDRNGVVRPCVVHCDSIITVEVDRLGRTIGRFFPDQEAMLEAAISAAFDLRS